MMYQYLIYSMDFSLYKGADLANLVNVAAIYAASEGDASVSTKHLEFAKDKIIMGKFDFTLSLICICFSFFLVFFQSPPCQLNYMSSKLRMRSNKLKNSHRDCDWSILKFDEHVQATMSWFFVDGSILFILTVVFLFHSLA